MFPQGPGLPLPYRHQEPPDTKTNRKPQKPNEAHPFLPNSSPSLSCQWGWLGPSAGMLYSFPSGKMICQIFKEMCHP